ncbi:MAG TPA: hypothetical protein VF637_04960 [Sphingomicrobium sp.]|jgi:serine O-acetyltransferase
MVLADFWHAVMLDAYRVNGSSSAANVLRLIATSRTFRPVFTLRWYQNAGPLSRLLARLAHRRACRSASIDLPATTLVGAGLLINHGWGIVVTRHAVIGRNVTLMHGATIGRGDTIDEAGNRSMGFPTIEDNVWIGPNATVVGGVVVGAGARILPGAIVHFDVPASTMVAGNPGQIIKTNVPKDTPNEVLTVVP